MEIHAIKPRAGASLILMLSVVAAIMTLMFMLDKTFFMSTDLTRLLIISFALAMPILLFNIFTSGWVALMFEWGENDAEKGLIVSSTTGAAISLMYMTLLMILEYFFNLSLKTLIIILLTIELPQVFLIRYAFNQNKKAGLAK